VLAKLPVECLREVLSNEVLSHANGLNQTIVFQRSKIGPKLIRSCPEKDTEFGIGIERTDTVGLIKVRSAPDLAVNEHQESNFMAVKLELLQDNIEKKIRDLARRGHSIWTGTGFFKLVGLLFPKVELS
jgi:hypothetical protein